MSLCVHLNFYSHSTPIASTSHEKMPIVNENGVLKLDNKDCKGPGRAVSEPWRVRKVPPKMSEQDHARKQMEHLERKINMQEHIKLVCQLIWELMDCLHKDFPEHTADWFYQYVMQQPKWGSKPRAISRWNTFVSLTLPKVNKSMSSLLLW